MKKIKLVTILCASTLVLGACTSKEFTDAPVGKVTPSLPADIITFPDHFGNVAFRCGTSGEMIYVTSHGNEASSIFVVPNSIGCRDR